MEPDNSNKRDKKVNEAPDNDSEKQLQASRIQKERRDDRAAKRGDSGQQLGIQRRDAARAAQAAAAGVNPDADATGVVGNTVSAAPTAPKPEAEVAAREAEPQADGHKDHPTTEEAQEFPKKRLDEFRKKHGVFQNGEAGGEPFNPPDKD